MKKIVFSLSAVILLVIFSTSVFAYCYVYIPSLNGAVTSATDAPCKNNPNDSHYLSSQTPITDKAEIARRFNSQRENDPSFPKQGFVISVGNDDDLASTPQQKAVESISEDAPFEQAYVFHNGRWHELIKSPQLSQDASADSSPVAAVGKPVSAVVAADLEAVYRSESAPGTEIRVTNEEFDQRRKTDAALFAIIDNKLAAAVAQAKTNQIIKAQKTPSLSAVFCTVGS